MAEVETPAKKRKSVKQKPLSLTKAATVVGVSTSTLRRAIDSGKLKANKTPEGHYRIAIDELMQYRSNEIDTPVDRGAIVAPTGVSTQSVAPPVDTPVGGVSTPLSTGVVLKEVHDARVEALESENRFHKETIRDLKDSVESWKTQAKSWQNHADNNLRLLTDERKSEEVTPPVEVIETTSSSKAPFMIALALVLVAGITAFLLYPDVVRELVASLTM